MTEKRDHYSVLQVSRAATQEAIDAAYRRLARLYDPALSKKPKAAARMKELNEAYEVLSDKKKRAQYDQEVAGRRGGRGAVIASRQSSGAAAGGLVSRLRARPLVWGGGLAGVAAVVIAVALVVTLGGDGGGEAASQLPSPTPAAGTASPSSPSLAPATPPPISGTEVVTESGLKYIDIAEGTGASPQLDQTVVVNYTGWLEDGTKFDSSLDTGQPLQRPLSGLIEGWQEGLSTMKAGGQRRLIIPAQLAYGEQGSPPQIPPNATLIFDVELLEVR